MQKLAGFPPFFRGTDPKRAAHNQSIVLPCPIFHGANRPRKGHNPELKE
ncbi:hypothetical protein [Rhodoferax sp. BAB1]|nr:hypothetical protein [Rhodoferax sp. BAB1]QKO23723.1 hypothetical protein HTY51_18400 [Rhodoferax sp. BAB1]